VQSCTENCQRKPREMEKIEPWWDEHFTINHVQLGVEIGRGAHARITTAKWNHLSVAMKEINSSIVDNIRKYYKEKFLQECEQSIKLSHRNVVKFIGLYYPVGSKDPRLVMEQLYCSLTERLEWIYRTDLLLDKLLLIDIASGLDYFHSQMPPIIHCDLTSDNILLTAKMVAKISNFATIRNVDPVSRHQMAVASKTRDFMPPEVLSDELVQYGAEVDVFSFGCVMLHTLSHQWPTPSQPVVTDPVTGEKRKQSEVERRQPYLAYDAAVGNYQLSNVITNCLSDFSTDRPSICDVLEYL